MVTLDAGRKWGAAGEVNGGGEGDGENVGTYAIARQPAIVIMESVDNL